MSNDLVKNYGFSETKDISNDLLSVNETRAMHEVQAAFVIAKRFPRDQNIAFSKIIQSCKRPFLAEQSMYAYPRGTKTVTGPSIRLAEVLLSCWGNCDAGIKEISQSNGVSIAEAYAIDLETNTRITKIFYVPHIRVKKERGARIEEKLTDPRDIYELVANQGARRMRACILGIIPGDITEAAIEECKKTLANGSEPLADRIRKMVLAFDEMGVKVEHIEKKLEHKLDAIVESELITLKSIYRSLKDGMAKREDFFDISKGSSASKSIKDIISEKKNLSKNKEEETIEAQDLKETKTKEVFLDDPGVQEFLNEMDNA